tara:strand:+ start:215 stop:1135 length:921 start_codon:yes stop_codon:yes gene_type:complete
MPSFRQLEYFLQVADTGSLRRAAKRLGVTQPTITAQLNALEQKLGVVLLERTRAATTLSPAGREIFPEVRQLMLQWHDLVESAHLLGDQSSSTYRLGVPPTLGPYLLPTLMPSIHQQFKRLRLYIREEVPDRLQQGLEDGDYDMIIGPFGEVNDRIVTEPLFREPLLLAWSPDMKVDFSGELREGDLSNLDVLALDERHALRREVEQICERTGARLNRSFEGTSLDTLREMVVMGMGIAFFPALYVRSEIHTPEAINVSELTGGRLFREHALLYRASAPSRGFYKSFGVLLREVIRRELSDVVIPR